MLLFIWLNIHSCVYVWGDLCRGSCVVELYGGTVWWSLGELFVVGGWGHAHQSPDGPGMHTPLPPVPQAQG